LGVAERVASVITVSATLAEAREKRVLSTTGFTEAANNTTNRNTRPAKDTGFRVIDASPMFMIKDRKGQQAAR
jgi:hypothetical protein